VISYEIMLSSRADYVVIRGAFASKGNYEVIPGK
jgi:hypothetical protein